ncbi:MAG: outer membrane protein transport protein [Chrysiogenia bacterium]
MKARVLTLLLLLLAPLLFSQYKPWFNFYNFTYGAKARAMGNAFAAVADDLTAAFWNPAGLAAMRSPEFYLSYKSLSQKHDYDLQERILINDTKLYNYYFNSQLNQIDFFSVSAPAVIWKRNWTFALSYYRYIPYGLKGMAREVITYLHNRLDTQDNTINFTGSEGIDVLAFSASAALTDHVALGVTMQQFFDSGSQHLSTEISNREYHSQFSEKLQGRNLVAGLLFSPFEFLRLGFTWHSGLRNNFISTLLTWEVNRKGDRINQLEDSCLARVVIPEQYALGALLRPAAWLDLSAEYSRLDWEKGTIENYYDFDRVLPYPQKGDWDQKQKNVRNLRFGAEARLPLRHWLLHLRGGWSADRQLYVDADDQAVVIKAYAAGLGCEFSRNLLLEIAYQSQKADWSEKGFFLKGPDVATHFRASVFNLSLTYRFGHIFKE